MNIDLILFFAFILVLFLLTIWKRKKLAIEKIAYPFIYIALYRTKLGLNLMDRLAKKHLKFFDYFARIGVIIGFLAMIFIFVILFKGVYSFLFLGAQPPIAPLFPGVKIAGMPVMSFIHWIIVIFILASVHEFNHGLISRAYNIKVKSSGFAVFSFLLPIIPAAFVEPDEEQLKKSKTKTQLGVLAAGSYANFITGGIFLLLFLFLLVPLSSSYVDETILVVESVEKNYPAELAGIKAGDEIISVNNINVNDIEKLTFALSNLKPNDKINLQTTDKKYELKASENPDNKSKGFIGINFENKINEKYNKNFVNFIFWLKLLVFWIFVANIGVGLFNLLPLGPLDGGRMFYVIALHFFNEKKAKFLWIGISLICLLLILISLSPFIIKLFSFIFSPFLSFIG